LKEIIFILLLFLASNTDAQEQSSIKLSIKTSDSKSLPEKLSLPKSFQSEYQILLALKEYINVIHSKGYLSASIDSLTGDSVQKTAYFHIGEKFDWVTLNTESVDEEILSRTGFRDKQFLNKPFNPKQINTFFNDALTYLENRGYPFAEIQLTDILIKKNNIHASVTLTKNKFYLIDSIQILGEDTRLSRNYIENMIRIKSKHPYDERIIKNISRRIRENPFIDELKPNEVIFTENSCTIILVLKPKKSNLFDGIIGFQPQPDNKGVVLTGDIKISLGNIVGQGERLNLRWQRLQDQTQEINASLDIPYLFKTPFGFGYQLKIYRRDTTFNNVEHQFNIPFKLSNGSQFNGYFNKFSTSLISTSAYQNSTEIPPYNDAKNNTYGLGYYAFFVQNKFNPYRGWTIQMNGGVGNNIIIKNNALEMVNYDSINLESRILEGRIKLNFFQPIGRHSTIMLQVNSGFKQSENLIDNQLYRIGGLSTLRGFDEQSLLVSSYNILTLEYRLLFSENSRISVFYDLGWYEQNTISQFKTDTPYGIGAGISFNTNAGLFSLNYALGSSLNNALNLRTGKIHFGFVNFF
jgi:hemolysin activation/secretion protein